mmetsp:Transcript_47943/g.111866  ORF Transcript_47943/g.111866 Transcript_47943/m.111866 type:complete len:591 (-) Transcript_47943:140-1912(-)
MEGRDADLQPEDACSAAAASVGDGGGDQLSPKAGRLRPRPRKKTKGSFRVHWDEQIIAEHDKERGTRQKIDEPDTPFIRSPQTASDSEGGVLSSDDEHAQHRLSWRADDAVYGGSCSSKAVPVPNPAEAGQSTGDIPCNGSRMDDVWHKDVTNRLNDWVLGKTNRRRSTDSCSVGSSDCGAAVDEHNCSHTSSACSSRSSSSAPHWRGRMVPLSSNESVADGKKHHHHDRRISLPEDSPQPKPSSDKFKAKRAQHYNEVAALKAFKKKFVSGEYSSPESDTSDEDKQETCEDVRTKTNTNTNLNQTLSKAVEWTGHSGEACSTPSGGEKGQKKKKQPTPKQSPAQGDADGAAAGSEHPEQAAAAAAAAQSSRRSSVSFSGESGGESSEEFRTHRNRHYAGEWHQDRVIREQVSSLETNTNTNINAGGACVSDKRGSQRNPMEAGRPPVHFGADSEGGSSQSEEFRARRQHHYNEVAAVRRFREESTPEPENTESSSEENLQVPVEGGKTSSTSGAANPCNPMEPRDSGVAFQESSPIAGDPSPSGQSRVQARSSEDDAAWRDKRAAHYSEMAAALRNMPPPSDEEDSDGD